MTQISHDAVIVSQAGEIAAQKNAIGQLQGYIAQLEQANKSVAAQYKQLQEKAGIAKDDPLYINFEAQPAPPPAAPQSLQAAVKTAVARKRAARGKKA